MRTVISTNNSNNTLQLGERVRAIRKSLKMTQKIFASSLGIVQSFLCAIEKGKKTPSNTLLIAAQHKYNINPIWLESGQGEPFSTSTPLSPLTYISCEIPLFKDPPASLNKLNPADITATISMPGLPAGSFAFEYSGDFMSPSIRDGDIVIVQPGNAPATGEIVLIVGKWGEAYLRRYRIRGDDIFYSADNSSYAPFKSDSNISILGTVHTVWRKIKT